MNWKVLVIGSLVLVILVSGCVREKGASIKSCLDDIEKGSVIAKENYPYYLSISIREYKKFDNTKDAINYLEEWEEWDSIKPTIRHELFSDFYSPQSSEVNEILIKHDNIVIVITIFSAYHKGISARQVSPIICINGTLTDKSRLYFENL